jgi:CRP-like cAMP-binding protein
MSSKEKDDNVPLSLSGFSRLLSENMQDRYFPKGHVVYKEGELGDKMYFISSGVVRVATSSGTSVTRGPGDFFGEGALLSPNKLRSATIECVTPVHALEVSKEYFDKYIAKSDTDLYLFLREKDNIRKRNRAKMILRMQKNLKEENVRYGDVVFRAGEDGDTIYIVDNGKIEMKNGENCVFVAAQGNIFGENSAITRRPRNVTATCSSLGGCKIFAMSGHKFRKLLDEWPELEASMRDLGFRRDFKKAVVSRLNKTFPYDNPKEAFDAVKSDKSQHSYLTKEEVAKLMTEFDPRYEDEQMVMELIKRMDFTQSGTVTYDEFKRVFIADIKGSASI